MTREELYIQFGPKLLEAVALLILDEINVLRGLASLPPRTQQQLVNVLEAKLSTIPDLPE